MSENEIDAFRTYTVVETGVIGAQITYPKFLAENGNRSVASPSRWEQ